MECFQEMHFILNINFSVHVPAFTDVIAVGACFLQ